MITGADAITQMRELDDIISDLGQVTEERILWYDSPAELFKLFANDLQEWRDEVTKAGGIKPVQSYAEVA